MTETANNLIAKIKNADARVAILGMGYVGLPLAVEFGKAGIRAVGIDVSQGRVDQINRGESYIGDVDGDELKELVDKGLIMASLPGPILKEVDAISICVPTPLRKSKDPDISYIVAATEEVAKNLRSGQLIVLESTTYPGTTDEVILPRLEETGLKVGEDFFLAFSPERVDPGNPRFNTRNTPKVVGGVTPDCVRAASALYSHAVNEVVEVTSTQAAEMVKLLENTFRSVNIGLVNELAIICDKLKVNVWEVIGAAATKPFGFMPFWPGPGLGGHCIPIDPHYLSWKLKTLNYHARFIELADEINSFMPEYVVDKVGASLNEDKKAVNGSRVLVMGLAYKKDVNDCRESPAIDMIRLLSENGAEVVFCDPHVDADNPAAKGATKVELTAAELSQADCTVIATDHSTFDASMIVEHSNKVVDARNLTAGIDAPEKIRRL